jgi:glycosidase
MMRRFQLIFWLVAISRLGFAQLSTNPALPINCDAVTISFDSSKETRLGYFTSDLYAHTGVSIEGKGDWQHVIGAWGNNTQQPKLTNKGNGIFELVINPNINSYYSVPPSELVKKMSFVFRSADGTRQTNDLFIDVFVEGLCVNITTPNRINLFDKSQAFQFSASSTLSADLKLFLNNQQIAAQTGTSIAQSLSVPDAGNYWLKVTATQNTSVARDSVYVCIRENTLNETRPSGLPAGINYTDNQSATLIIYAPKKNHLFVTGDFNNWLPDINYQMKKDGDYFWLKIGNLIPQKEYIFQYLIDGSLKVADPYSDKISDPYDDKYISSTVYPNMLPYPEGKASDRASVLQTAQTPFVWNTTNYNVPEASNLSIYELLIRDFTEEGTYKALQAKLDYLKRLGINTIELMPFSEFEGNISWGYNPNFLFAPDKAYGTKNDLKALIDECHKQGFIVIQDIVLNHSFNSNPMVKMYWNSSLNRPAADNPWFNEVSPNTTYFWGSDFNHESQATKDFVDRVTNYWMTEYKVDGFRFDFTKGFTNTPGDGGGYDAARIAILKRMADKIWEVNPKAIVILEHFAANTEEQQLAAYGNGMLIWGNSNYNFCEAAMGYNTGGNSDFSWASYQKRGFTKPGLVAYMESHDEERQMFKTESYGNSLGTYNTKEFDTALDRSKLATAFFMSLAGPKMIWQFGELGYDFSINQCEDGSISDACRTNPKPVRWNYLDDPKRQKLFDVYSAMLRLRAQFDVFTKGKETLSVSGATKTIQLSDNAHNITLVGNFDVINKQVSVNFQHTGTWFEFFSGANLEVTSTTSTFTLNPGEYRLYSDKELPAFKDLATTVSGENHEPFLQIYPNPVSERLHIDASEQIQKMELYSIDGKQIYQSSPNTNRTEIDFTHSEKGIFILRIFADNQLFTKKIVKN